MKRRKLQFVKEFSPCVHHTRIISLPHELLRHIISFLQTRQTRRPCVDFDDNLLYQYFLTHHDNNVYQQLISISRNWPVKSIQSTFALIITHDFPHIFQMNPIHLILNVPESMNTILNLADKLSCMSNLRSLILTNVDCEDFSSSSQIKTFSLSIRSVKSPLRLPVSVEELSIELKTKEANFDFICILPLQVQKFRFSDLSASDRRPRMSTVKLALNDNLVKFHLRQFSHFPQILGGESIQSFKIDSGWLGNLNPILCFPNLRHLHLHVDDLRSLLKALGFLPKLRKISVEGMPFDFREFAKYPQLEELDITGAYVSYREKALREAIIQDAMDTLKPLPMFRTLRWQSKCVFHRN
jgi:hypothetical protein